MSEPSSRPRRRPAKRDRYHHGDLRTALIQTAIDVVEERGMPAFSMAEASRRLGVAVAAPYRHFVDREALLAAVAGRAAELLVERLDRDVTSGSPAQRLAAATRGYVRFAADHHALFQTLVASGLNKTRHLELHRAGQQIGAVFLSPALELLGGDHTAAAQLTAAIVASAHGHAVLLLDDCPGPDQQSVEAAAQHAAQATTALILGREALLGPTPKAMTASNP
jgi:AcrR family transcriptional regulator